MKESRITLLMIVCALTLSFATVSSCASTGGAKAAAKHEKVASKKKTRLPKNYSLVKSRDVNYKLLRRGQKIMGSNALDEY